jgi:uncharacterized protein (DUF58 family)
MFGLRRRLEAWRGRPSQPSDAQALADGEVADGAGSLDPALIARGGAAVVGAGLASAVVADAPANVAPGRPPVADVTRQAEALMRRLEWTVIRRLDGQLQGDYRTLFRGAGLMLADLREYQAHDDVRHIDWNVTARMQTPYVREHQEDREMAAWFLIDLSRSVAFGSGQTSKRMLAAEVVGVLARMLTRRGNRVGAMVYTGEHTHAEFHIPARSGRRYMLHLLQTVMQAQANQPTSETHLQNLLNDAQNLIRRRSTIFVVSDFFSQPGWERGLSQLARRHEVVALRLCDPLERQLPDVGLVLMEDAETGEQLLVDTHDAGFRERFAQAAAQREADLRTALVHAGVDGLELHTDQPLDEALMRFTQLRKRRSQVAAGATSAVMAAGG